MSPTDGSRQCAITLVILKHLCTSLIDWKPVGHWLLTTCFLNKHGKMTITDMYYSLLQSAIEDISSHDISIVMNDAKEQLHPPNVTWCPNHTSWVTHMLILLPMTMENTFSFFVKILATALQIHGIHVKCIHHWTWYSSDGTTRKPIDHILISLLAKCTAVLNSVTLMLTAGCPAHDETPSRSFCKIQNLPEHVSLARPLYYCKIHLLHL